MHILAKMNKRMNKIMLVGEVKPGYQIYIKFHGQNLAESGALYEESYPPTTGLHVLILVA